VEGVDATTSSPDLARLNLNGSLDSTFGTGGIAFEGGLNAAGLHPSIALQSDGEFVLGADSQTIRLLSNGAPDTTFGTNGVSVAAPVPMRQFWSEAVAIQPNGEIVLVGLDDLNSQDFAVARFLAAGPRVGSFTASSNPVTAIGSVTLTASNLTDTNPGATITQVAFYYLDNSGNQHLLGYAAQTSPGVWTLSFSPSTFSLTSGTYTLFAQAEDSYGVFSDPFALTLTVQ
jgi:hypothetical protein